MHLQKDDARTYNQSDPHCVQRVIMQTKEKGNLVRIEQSDPAGLSYGSEIYIFRKENIF
jgi:hypothetical protein